MVDRMAKSSAELKTDIRLEAEQSLGRRVLSRIRADILSLALVPGRIVSERDLQGIYGASRTPIRQALLQLIGEGLIVRTARGYAIAPIDTKQLADVFEFRQIVETAAIRLACERAGERELDALQATIDRGLDDASPETWFAIGADVHVMLASLSGNEFLSNSVRDIVTRIARARWLIVSTEAGRRESHREHSEMVALIREKKMEAAQDLIRQHARNVQEQIMQALRNAPPHYGALGIVVKCA